MGKSGSVSLLLGDDASIAELNQQFRNKAGPTNVLSFPPAPGAEPGFLGDIALAAESNKDAPVPDDVVRTPHVTSSRKELTRAELAVLRRAATADKRTVVWTNGVFDVLHTGHLSQLRGARELGDILVVGVNADETVRASKGDNRPVFPLADPLPKLSCAA